MISGTELCVFCGSPLNGDHVCELHRNPSSREAFLCAALRRAEEFIDRHGHTRDPGDNDCEACSIVAQARAALGRDSL